MRKLLTKEPPSDRIQMGVMRMYLSREAYEESGCPLNFFFCEKCQKFYNKELLGKCYCDCEQKDIAGGSKKDSRIDCEGKIIEL